VSNFIIRRRETLSTNRCLRCLRKGSSLYLAPAGRAGVRLFAVAVAVPVTVAYRSADLWGLWSPVDSGAPKNLTVFFN
jgi:hypothetical protein